jgi:hypothetical protein
LVYNMDLRMLLVRLIRFLEESRYTMSNDACLSICPSVNLSVFMSVFMSVCLSDCLSVCLSVFLSVYLSVCQSVYEEKRRSYLVFHSEGQEIPNKSWENSVRFQNVKDKAPKYIYMEARITLNKSRKKFILTSIK